MPLDKGDCTVIMEYIMHTASLCHWIMEYMHSNNGIHNAYSFAMPLDNGDCTVIMEYIMHTASLCHWIMETAQ